MPFSSPVIQSTRIEAAEQIDGRFSVREVHQASGGEREEFSFIADIGEDLDAILATHGQQFLSRLAGVSNG